MKKADREARRQRIQAIEQAEAHARCAWCKRSFKEAGVIIEDFVFPGKFCSDACLDAAKEAHAAAR